MTLVIARTTMTWCANSARGNWYSTTAGCTMRARRRRPRWPQRRSQERPDARCDDLVPPPRAGFVRCAGPAGRNPLASLMTVFAIALALACRWRSNWWSTTCGSRPAISPMPSISRFISRPMSNWKRRSNCAQCAAEARDRAGHTGAGRRRAGGISSSIPVSARRSGARGQPAAACDQCAPDRAGQHAGADGESEALFRRLAGSRGGAGRQRVGQRFSNILVVFSRLLLLGRFLLDSGRGGHHRQHHPT